MINPENIRVEIDKNIEPINAVLEPFEFEEFDVTDTKSKEYQKYKKFLKGMIRTSFEYKNYIGYLRDVLDMRECAIYEDISNYETFSISIEIHHCPFTLEDIIDIIVEKRKRNAESTCIEDVADEIMQLHYQGYIGLIPISLSLHEMVHNRVFMIPMNYVKGDYEGFVEIYKDYISDDMKFTYQKYKEVSEKYTELPEEFKNLLKVEPINIKTNYNIEDCMKFKTYLEENKLNY